MKFPPPETLGPSEREELKKAATGAAKLWRWVGFLQLSTPRCLLCPHLRWSLIDRRANLRPFKLIQNGARACK